jgi:arginase
MYSDYRVRIIGVPLGLGGRQLGANLGPDALRLAGIADQLKHVVSEVFDGGDVEAVWGAGTGDRGEGLGHFEQVLANLVLVREVVGEAIGPKSIPVVLGGDHSIELATIPAAIDKTDGRLGVLWIDAHADFNTPETSPSGNLHGMALAGVCGLECGVCKPPMAEQWERLLHAIAPSGHFLSPDSIVWMGLRDVDPGEAARIVASNPNHAISMHEIDRYGMAAMLRHAIESLLAAGVTRLWVSFDADVLDPLLAPGTGTHVRGGLTYREAHLLAELLYEALREESGLKLVGVKIAEVNPLLDQQNQTAVMCVEWVASLLGKRTLPAWPQLVETKK